MRLRQAKKIMGWSKGDGDYISIHRSKDNRDSFWRWCNKLRPGYYNEKGNWVQPSCHDIDIIRRAHTRLFRWIRKGKKIGVKKQKIGNSATNNKNQIMQYD